MKRIYIVTFDIKRQCRTQSYAYYCEASNAKEAVEIARSNWRLSSHQFHIHAVKSRIQDGNALCVRNWLGKECKGMEVIGWYIMTNSRTWRVDGHNLYA